MNSYGYPLFNYVFLDRYVSKVFISASYSFSNPISYDHVIDLFKNDFHLPITGNFKAFLNILLYIYLK